MNPTIIKKTLDVISKHLFKNAIKNFHPEAEKITRSIFSPTRIDAIGSEEKWLKENAIERKKKDWSKDRHIEFDLDNRDWTDEDMRSAMRRKDYPRNKKLQRQVANYFKRKHPGHVTYL